MGEAAVDKELPDPTIMDKTIDTLPNTLHLKQENVPYPGLYPLPPKQC